MTHDNKEIEIKIKIDNINEFENKVKCLQPQVIDEVFQRTTRFDTNNGDLEKRGIFVRVRSGSENT